MQDTLYSNYNVDDVFMRSILGGLLELLNNKIIFKQVWSDDNIEEVEVPFLYDFGSSGERFIQDNYTFFGNTCKLPRKIDGKFDSYPRGIISLDNSSIDAARITNRFIQGTYTKDVDGKLQSFVSFLYEIPIDINFTVKIRAENLISLFKIEQLIREVFYKNKTFYTLYKGMQIGSRVGFPEADTIEKSTEFSYNTKNEFVELTFQLGVETYQPVFDPTTEMKRGNIIKSFAYDMNIVDGSINKKYNFVYPSTNLYISKYSPFNIQWDYTSLTSDQCSVNISYIDSSNNKYYIAKGIQNQTEYNINFPNNITTYKEPVITYDANSVKKIIRYPVIYIKPQLNNIINENSFIIDENGYFIDDSSINFTLEYKVGKKLVITNPITLNIFNGQINLDNPINLNGQTIRYNIANISKQITLRIEDSVYPDFYADSSLITIV